MATKTIGAMHGEGGVTVPSNSASPVEVAGVVPATRLTTVGAPAASLLWQLRIIAKLAMGLAPVPTSTRPRTLTSSSPLAFSSAFPEVIFHGAPPPPMPRIGLAAPVNGGTTAVSRLNSNMLGTSGRFLFPLSVAEAAPRKTRQTKRANSFFIILSISQGEKSGTV